MIRKTLLLLFLAASISSAQTPLPDLARLKVAAEQGDPIAQFDYAARIRLSNPKESFAICLKSAQQGYGPAEDQVGRGYASSAAYAGKEKLAMTRLAVRYTSRAAFKGIPSAMARLGEFYERGNGVPKDLGLAYGWRAVALKFAGGPTNLDAISFKGALDQLIARISIGDIARGEQFARTFQVNGENFVEIDLLVRQLKVDAVLEKGGKKIAIVNQTRLVEGETKELRIDGEVSRIRCESIEGKVVTLGVGEYSFTLSSR